MTVVDHSNKIETFQHDLKAARQSAKRIKRRQHRAAGGRKGSRRWKRRITLSRRLRAKLANGLRHRRRSWANHVVHRHDTVWVEKLGAGNMSRSARGTAENPGTNAKVKGGLNRSLVGTAPAEQTAIVLRAREPVSSSYEPPAPASGATPSATGTRTTARAMRCSGPAVVDIPTTPTRTRPGTSGTMASPKSGCG